MMTSNTTAKIDTKCIDQGTTEVIAFLIKDFLSPLQVRSAVNEIICTKVAAAAKTILKIVQNALQVSTNKTIPTSSSDGTSSSSSHQGTYYDAAMVEKYRKIRLANKVINERVVKQPGAIDLLTSIGFVYDDTSTDGEKYLLFVPDQDGVNVGLASFFCSTMQDELTKYKEREMEMNKNKKEHHPSDNHGNEFLSQEERKARHKKGIAAKKAQKAERERAIARWNEDKGDRQEIKERKELVKNVVVKSKRVAIAPKERKANIVHRDEQFSSDPMQSLQSLRAAAKASWENKRGKINVVVDTTEDANMDVGNNEINDEQINEVKDQKMPALPPSEKIQFSPDNSSDLSPSWEECLKHIPRCAPAANIRETSVLYQRSNGMYNASLSSPKCFKRLFAEFDELETLLPSDKQCSAWIRFDEETPQYIRALLTAPLPGPSPYAGGVFAFDIHIPDDYPMTSPQARIVTTGQGTVRFGPNLYADGKVCLSLLGTWEGPKWDPKNSSLYQVLVSIQSLMLGVEHPYFLEPGHGGWEAKIKEGDFASVGHTLQGDEIREEIKLGPEVWLYEDTIRLGSIRFAMIEPLLLAAKVGNSRLKPSIKNLEPFEDVIKAHFFHNGNATLAAVVEWLNTIRPSAMKEQSSKTLQTIHELFPQLQSAVAQVQRPSLTAALKSASAVSVGMGKDPNYNAKSVVESQTNTEQESDIDRLRYRMNEAAQNNNFILAGQLQKEIQAAEKFDHEVNSLRAEIDNAAASGDFIRAGELQAKVKRKEADMKKRKAVDSFGNNSFSTSKSPYQPHTSAGTSAFEAQVPLQANPFNNDFAEDGFENEGQMEVDEDSDNGAIDYSEPEPYYNSGFSNWGTGQQLGETMDTKPHNFNAKVSIQKEDNSKKHCEDNIDHEIARFPINEPCRVRVRLPESMNETLNEIFDSSEKLSTLYKLVKAYIERKSKIDSTMPSPRLMQLRGMTNESGNQAVAIQGGAFANPSSEYGFTLVTPHPKREFNLEMYGSRTLKDLGIFPSCTLVVMMCSLRGQVKRGILESKLGAAQGDAMDVDGLNYEALQELGEKIGYAAPGDGSYKGIGESQLDEISTLINAKDYLAQKSVQESDTRCPICLGDFDVESDCQLRMLMSCGHTFHSSCLMTWLRTKTNCPVCKSSLSTKDQDMK